MEERFRKVSGEFLDSYVHRIEACVARMSEEQVWWRPHAGANSVGNLLLHLQGNLSQWVLAGLGGDDYQRRRTAEFEAESTAPKSELLGGLRRVVEQCQSVISALAGTQLAQPRSIQGYEVDGLYVAMHAVEHMSYHTGQIAYIAKLLLGPDSGIDFYPQHHGE